MGKDINFKEFNLNDIEWNKIKGGLTKEELCKGNKKLECIFDAINKDKVTDKLSNSELQAFCDSLLELSGDEILDKKEVHQFRDIRGKKVNYKDIFAFLMELKKHESTDENLITTYTTTKDGEDVEVTEYRDGRVEEVAVDGSWTKLTQVEETPVGQVKREYLNGVVIRSTTTNGSLTIIDDILNNVSTRILNMGNGLQRKEITEKPSDDYKKLTVIQPNGDKTLTEYKNLSDGLQSVTTTNPDLTQKVEYKGVLYISPNSKARYMRMETINDYIEGKWQYNLDDKVISLIKNSQMDEESKKIYIAGIVDRIIEKANVLADYSTKELDEELDRFLDDEISDVTNIQSLYKQTAEALKIVEESDLNGLIDKDFEQGGVGDCYLLAVIKSLSMHPYTEAIINDCVKIDKDGNARVTLKGVNKTFTVTKAELESDNYSNGDPDVKAIEIAVEKYLKKYGDPFDRSDKTLDSGNERSAYFILTGKTAYYYKGVISDKLLAKINKNNTLACVAITNSNRSSIKLSSNTRDGEIVLETGHSYTFAGSDENYVYLINPWDTSTKIQLTRTEFKKYFNDITILDA